MPLSFLEDVTRSQSKIRNNHLSSPIRENCGCLIGLILPLWNLNICEKDFVTRLKK